MKTFIEEFIEACEVYGIGPWKVDESLGYVKYAGFGEFLLMCPCATCASSITLWIRGQKPYVNHYDPVPQQYADKVNEILNDKD